jgi:hypothetical protein
VLRICGLLVLDNFLGLVERLSYVRFQLGKLCATSVGPGVGGLGFHDDNISDTVCVIEGG